MDPKGYYGATDNAACVKKSTPFDAVFRSVDRALRAAERAEALNIRLNGGGLTAAGKPPVAPASASVFGQVRDAGDTIEGAISRINDALDSIEATLP